MTKRFLAVFFLLFTASLSHADRITEMSPLDRCVYIARLEMAVHHHFQEGRPRDQFVIHWHGDETTSEIALVNRSIDHAYAWLQQWKESSSEMLPQQSFGEMILQACMEGKL